MADQSLHCAHRKLFGWAGITEFLPPVVTLVKGDEMCGFFLLSLSCCHAFQQLG
jgi:hypothetical protein